jgi:hypothetical protein
MQASVAAIRQELAPDIDTDNGTPVLEVEQRRSGVR